MFDVWNSVQTEIEHSVSRAVFVTWFKNISLISLDDEKIVIGVPNVFYLRQMESKFYDIVKNAFIKNNIDVKKIEFIVKAEGKTKVTARETTGGERLEKIEKIKRTDSKILNKNFNTGLNPKYTMDNFVVGSNNDLAVSVAHNVIENPGDKYNPFFLYGGPGLGKTHLVQAIGNELLKRNPNLKIFYTPVNHFYSDFITSIKDKKSDEFVKKFQKLDVLIIDDFQMIINKDASQEQFFNIFNDLYNLNKQIIVTSDRLPNQIKSLDERLSSRLAMAGAIDLQMPNFEDRCAILTSKAEFMGVDIEKEAIEFIAETVKTNIRDLESEFSRVLAMSELKNLSPLDLINNGYVSVLQKNSKTRGVTAKQVLDKVAKYYDLSVKEMCGKSRVSHIKNARQIAMFLLSKELQMSTPKIASEVGVKDHTTVMHGIKKIEADLKLNFGLRSEIEEIKERIYG